MKDLLLSRSEVARRLGVCRRTVSRWITAGVLPTTGAPYGPAIRSSLVDRIAAAGRPPTVRADVVPVDDAMVAAMIGGYAAGESLAVLSARYGVCRARVAAEIRAHGGEIRSPGRPRKIRAPGGGDRD